MGTSVATELLARRERRALPLELQSVTLMNGSVHVELAHLTLGQKLLRSPLGDVFARLNSRVTFEAQLRRTFGREPDEARSTRCGSSLARRWRGADVGDDRLRR